MSLLDNKRCMRVLVSLLFLNLIDLVLAEVLPIKPMPTVQMFVMAFMIAWALEDKAYDN